MLQEPYDSLGVTYYQASQVSSGPGTLVGSKFKYGEHIHLLYYQCYSVSLHGSRFHNTSIHVHDIVKNISLLTKKNIPLGMRI